MRLEGGRQRLLPPLALPTDVIGQVTPQAAAATGLAAGTPVVAGYFDGIALALRSRAIGAGAASVVLCSWSINQTFADVPARDARIFMVSAFGEGRFANMDNSATSAANLEWYVRMLVERGGHQNDPFGHVDGLVGRAPVAADDPVVHPSSTVAGSRPHRRQPAPLVLSLSRNWRIAGGACRIQASASAPPNRSL